MEYMSVFSGIGGFELGFPASWQCVGFSEVDKYAISIYQSHFCRHTNYGDITTINPAALPDFDLLCGGFPCQSFSIAGKRGGFADTRGTLFFEIARIAADKRPRLLLLENVKGLLSHDFGLTFERCGEIRRRDAELTPAIRIPFLGWELRNFIFLSCESFCYCFDHFYRHGIPQGFVPLAIALRPSVREALETLTFCRGQATDPSAFQSILLYSCVQSLGDSFSYPAPAGLGIRNGEIYAVPLPSDLETFFRVGRYKQ